MPATIPLDELIGICNEISSLSRAGLPLEKTLSSAQTSRLQERLKQMASELETGTSLADTVRNDPAFPPFYTVVMEAGLASGDLPGVLDTVARHAKELRDARLFVIRATLYPMFLFTILWLVLAGIFFFLSPAYLSFC